MDPAPAMRDYTSNYMDIPVCNPANGGISHQLPTANVIPFNLNGSSSRQQVQGVFKILKPGIRKHLEEEIIILEKTAAA
jgi:hypothetical protein